MLRKKEEKKRMMLNSHALLLLWEWTKGQKRLFKFWTKNANFLLCFLPDLGRFIFGGLWCSIFSPSSPSNQMHLPIIFSHIFFPKSPKPNKSLKLTQCPTTYLTSWATTYQTHKFISLTFFLQLKGWSLMIPNYKPVKLKYIYIYI